MSFRQQKKLLAVDPSLTASGWALFTLSESQPRAVGIISPPGNSLPLASRFQQLHDSVMNLFSELSLGAGDFLVCEGPAPLVRNPQSALKVEGVRGTFEGIARSRGVAVPGRLNPRTIQSELLGMRGPQLPRAVVKDWARDTALKLYGQDLRRMLGEEGEKTRFSQDIIDALLIGTVALARLQQATALQIPAEPLFANSKARGQTFGRRSGWSEADLRKVTTGVKNTRRNSRVGKD